VPSPPVPSPPVLVGRAVGILVVLLAGPAAWACPVCREAARARVFEAAPVGTAALLLLPLLVVAAVGALLYTSDRLPGERHEDRTPDA
jgi:hypothetical protein